MKSEQEIKEKLAYLNGYVDAGLAYGIPLDDRYNFAGQIKALEWVLKNEVKNVDRI